jgi:hypothetical protein
VPAMKAKRITALVVIVLKLFFDLIIFVLGEHTIYTKDLLLLRATLNCNPPVNSLTLMHILLKKVHFFELK